MQKLCEIKDCDISVGFRGYGHELCWKHYTEWIASFRASDSLRVSERHPQVPLPFGDMPDYDPDRNV